MAKCKNKRVLVLGAAMLCALLSGVASSQTLDAGPLIDLPTALRLAGAENLDVQIARERMFEARANQQRAQAQFFPWIAPGISYRRHDDQLADVAGNVIEVHKLSYAPGIALNAQVDLGEAIYSSLASRQLTRAAEHGLEAQRQGSVLAAALRYFDLAQAQAAVGVNRDSVRIARDYESQLQKAVSLGIAFKGDALRARVRMERNQLALRRAEEQQRLASARLAQTLHLDPTLALMAVENNLAPITLVTNAALNHLVAQALGRLPELRQAEAFSDAARESWKGTQYGPLIPTLGAQAFFGGLGGGSDGGPHNFGRQEDYFVGATWRLGPGGLFDSSRIRIGETRMKSAELAHAKLREEVTRQVVDAATRWQSRQDQIDTAQRAMVAAEEGFRLAQQRREFGVGVVLETLQAEEDLTHARLDYLSAVAELNRSQYELERVTGGL